MEHTRMSEKLVEESGMFWRKIRGGTSDKELGDSRKKWYIHDHDITPLLEWSFHVPSTPKYSHCLGWPAHRRSCRGSDNEYEDIQHRSCNGRWGWCNSVEHHKGGGDGDNTWWCGLWTNSRHSARPWDGASLWNPVRLHRDTRGVAASDGLLQSVGVHLGWKWSATLFWLPRASQQDGVWPGLVQRYRLCSRWDKAGGRIGLWPW